MAFVPNGAILPRASGAADTPMQSPNVVAFRSPPNLERTFVLPHRGPVTGMAIPKGITMVAGGGFHVSFKSVLRLVRGPGKVKEGDDLRVLYAGKVDASGRARARVL